VVDRPSAPVRIATTAAATGIEDKAGVFDEGDVAIV
jgi:hypothetical protein